MSEKQQKTVSSALSALVWHMRCSANHTSDVEGRSKVNRHSNCFSLDSLFGSWTCSFHSPYPISASNQISLILSYCKSFEMLSKSGRDKKMLTL